MLHFVEDTNHPKDGFILSMVLADGRPKCLRIELSEKGLWPKDRRRFLAECSIRSGTGKSTKVNPRCMDRGSFYAHTGLASQRDFRAQRSKIEEAILNAGHEIIFYPAFHCEINFIEYYWGAAKHYTHENCKYDFKSLKRLVPEALVGVTKHLIWKY